MRRIGTLADRFLNRLVPGVKVSASCVYMEWNWECGGGGFQHCIQYKDCTVVCGPCDSNT